MYIVAVFLDNYNNNYKKALALVGAFFLIAGIEAQTIKGKILPQPKYQYLYLDEVIGGKGYILDSIAISKGEYQFNLPESPKGYYRLRYTEQNKIDFINNQKPIEINFESEVLQNNLTVVQSIENKILWQYKYYGRLASQKKKGLIVRQSFLEKGSEEWIKLQLQKDSITIAKRAYLNTLCQENPNLLFTQLVGATQREVYNTKEAEKEHFFDNIDYPNPLLLRSSIFPSVIMNYFQTQTEYSENGFKESIDRILNLAAANDDNYEFCLNFILELFNRVGPDVVFQYVVETYLLDGGCSDANVSTQIKELANNYRAVMPGNKAPNFQLYDIQHNQIDLYTELTKKEATILFFWSSHCGFCSTTTPLLTEWIKTQPKVQIIGVSTDRKEEEWKKYVTKNKIEWVNVCDFNGWESEVIQHYKVHKTPSFYVLNSRGIIVSKPKSFEAISTLDWDNIK